MTDQPPPGVTPASEAGTKATCAANRTDGQACRSQPRPGRPFCLWHDPEAEDIRAAARVKGGQTATRLRAIRGYQPRLDSTQRLVIYVSRLVYQVMAGTLDQNIARTVIYALMLQKGLIETGDLERRLAIVEARLAENSGRRSVSWPA